MTLKQNIAGFLQHSSGFHRRDRGRVLPVLRLQLLVRRHLFGDARRLRRHHAICRRMEDQVQAPNEFTRQQKEPKGANLRFPRHVPLFLGSGSSSGKSTLE